MAKKLKPADDNGIPIPAAPKFNATDVSDLERVIASCEVHAKRVADAVNPTNIFVLRYQTLAEAAAALIALISTRGHTGVPGEE